MATGKLADGTDGSKKAATRPGWRGAKELVSQMLALPGIGTDPQTSTSTE